jgi:hypothetical protein
VIIFRGREEATAVGLVRRPVRRIVRRYLRAGPRRLLAATRAWASDQPSCACPAALDVHAELRAASHLGDTTDA